NNDNKMIVAELKQAFKASTGRYPIINHPINLTNHNQILKAISKIKDSQYLQKSIQWDWMLDNLDKIIAGEYDDYKKKKYYKPQSKRDKPNNDEILILRKMYHDLGLSEQEIEEAIRREE
ncbi:MAG: hypothetical protein Q4Q13_05960, partial [Vagococcus sp.]|nr:hypothetical protein [Vagococcus sp.]